MRTGNNIVLIGMPGVGKSTVGVLLAKQLGMSFMDTDIHIQVRQGKSLQEIIDTSGVGNFCAIEEESVLSVSCGSHVIATGGSVVYGSRAMNHLKKMGTVIHLDLQADKLEKRLAGNIHSRGVVMEPGRTIGTLYQERHPLYLKYADMTIDCEGASPDTVVGKIIRLIQMQP